MSSSGLRSSRRAGHGPGTTLAMVDAFVGGVSILLILLILSARSDPLPGQHPQSDMVVRCTTEGVLGLGETALDPDRAIRSIGSADAPRRLTLRVRIDVEPDALGCLSRLRSGLDALNDAADAGERTGVPHILAAPLIVEGRDE